MENVKTSNIHEKLQIVNFSNFYKIALFFSDTNKCLLMVVMKAK